MTAPILYGAPWWWELNSDPTTNVDSDNGFIGYANLWRNTSTNNVFICTDAGDFQNNGLQWKYAFSLLNGPSQINSSRNYSIRSAPDFNTSYLPSSTNDTMVTVVLSLTSTLLTPSIVQFLIDSGSGFTAIAESSLSGLSATNAQTITCLVPINSHYKIINTSGASSIVSINEIQL